MTSLVYLLTRAQSDFGENMLRLVAEADVFDAGDCVVVEHDTETHQLRVIGSNGVRAGQPILGHGALRGPAAYACRRVMGRAVAASWSLG